MTLSHGASCEFEERRLNPDRAALIATLISTLENYCFDLCSTRSIISCQQPARSPPSPSSITSAFIFPHLHVAPSESFLLHLSRSPPNPCIYVPLQTQRKQEQSHQGDARRLPHLNSRLLINTNLNFFLHSLSINDFLKINKINDLGLVSAVIIILGSRERNVI